MKLGALSVSLALAGLDASRRFGNRIIVDQFFERPRD